MTVDVHNNNGAHKNFKKRLQVVGNTDLDRLEDMVFEAIYSVYGDKIGDILYEEIYLSDTHQDVRSSLGRIVGK